MRSHFEFSKGQRNGIFLLLILILIFQFVYLNIDASPDSFHADSEELLKYRKEIDSLKQSRQNSNQPKIYPFNPNFITDYKGYTLGMSTLEIDRLLAYRAADKWIYSATDFQNVTLVSDSLRDALSPYFKFPDWVTQSQNSSNAFKSNKAINTVKSYAQKTDLNTATAEQLRQVNGIGEKLSQGIINYRSKFVGGFLDDLQLNDIYGLKPEVIDRIKNDFTVKTPRAFVKLNINTASKDELVTIQYIDYEIAHHIIEARTLREGFKSLEELTKVKKFPSQKIEIIALYLTID